MPVEAKQVEQRIAEILDAKAQLTRLTLKPYSDLNPEEKISIRYHIIVLVEALGAICMHVAREDLQQEPLSYSECFRLLDEQDISSNCARELTALVRLRNLLTHRYWVIDDNQVYNSIKNDFKSVDRFIEGIQDKYAIDL